MRGLNCRIDYKTNALKKRATPARSFASLRASPLYVTTGSLGSISFFCCYTGVRGFESSLSTPSQAVRLRSLHHLPNVRRPLRGLKLGGHAPANSLTNRKSASVSEPKFEPRKGRQPLGRWWSGEAAEPLLAKKENRARCDGASATQRRATAPLPGSFTINHWLFGESNVLSPQVPWVPFIFLILAGVPFADAHSTACLRAAAPIGASSSASLALAIYSSTSDLSSSPNSCIEHKLTPFRRAVIQKAAASF